MNRLLFLLLLSCSQFLVSPDLTGTGWSEYNRINPSADASVKVATADRNIKATGIEEEKDDGFIEVEGSGAEMLQPGYIPGSDVRLNLVSISNYTESSEFKIFYGSGSSRGHIFPATTFTFDEALRVTQSTPIELLCSKGSYLSIFVQDEGRASGDADAGYDGPYYLAMWLEYPQVSEQEKVFVRYEVASGTVGKVGIKIGAKGQCQIVALENVKIL